MWLRLECVLSLEVSLVAGCWFISFRSLIIKLFNYRLISKILVLDS